MSQNAPSNINLTYNNYNPYNFNCLYHPQQISNQNNNFSFFNIPNKSLNDNNKYINQINVNEDKGKIRKSFFCICS